MVVAHVGDSRCYLLRDGDLIRLTRDHSLVGELVARGKLTEEQAESHPQRSVITRALGPEPSVEVDVEVFPARAGDVFLLCSDGLTGDGPRAGAQAAAGGPRAARSSRPAATLIAAANEAGGRDNITVILFRLEEVDDRAAATARAAGRPRRADRRVRHVRRRGGRAAPGRQRRPPRRPRPTQPRRSTAATAPSRCRRSARRPRRRAVQRLRPASHRERTVPLPGRAAAAARRRRRRAAPAALLLLLLAVVLPLIVGAWLATRAVYFVGTDPGDGRTVDDLPRAAVRAAVRRRPLRALLRVRRARSPTSRRRAARASPTTSCARATTPRTS